MNPYSFKNWADTNKSLAACLVLLILLTTVSMSFSLEVSADYGWTGAWTTIASADSGGPAACSMAVDKDGNLFVINNDQVAKLAKDSTEWQVLSKTGLSAGAVRIAVDKDGSLYVVSGSNSVVQYLQYDGTQWQNIGGKYQIQVWIPGEWVHIKDQWYWSPGRWASSSAYSGGITSPYGIAVDKDGRVYVTNGGVQDSMQYYNSVMKLEDGAWSITGNKYNGDLPSYVQDVAVDEAGDVYVTTQYSSGTNIGEDSIRKYSGGVWSYAGDVEANRPVSPSSIAVDKWGNIYVVSRGDHTLKVFSGGKWTTIGGKGIGGLYDPEVVAVDASGNIYATDGTNKRIMKLQAPASKLVWITQPTDGVAGHVPVQAPKVALMDENSIVETGDNTTKVTLTINSSNGTSISGATATLQNGIATFDALTVNKAGAGYTLTPSCDLSPGLLTQESSPFGMTVPAAPVVTGVSPSTASGGTAVTITGNNLTGASIVEFGTVPGIRLAVNSDTSITVIAPTQAAGAVNVRVTTPGGKSAVNSPSDIFTYPQPGAWVGDWETIGSTSNGGFQRPTGIAALDSDTVHVVDYRGKFLKHLSGGLWFPMGDELFGPLDVVLDRNGTDTDEYVIDGAGENIIYKNRYPIINFYDYNNPWYGFVPMSLDVDSSDNIYIAGIGKVLRYDGTSLTDITYDGDFKFASGIAVDKWDNIYVTDSEANLVKKLAAGANTWTTIGTGFNYPQGIAVDDIGNIYVADCNNNVIKKLPIGAGGWTSIGGGFFYPEDVSVDISGNLYVLATGYNSASLVLKHQPIADRLSWETEPVNGTAGTYLNPSPTAILTDSKGNIQTKASGQTVTLDLIDPAGAVLSGGTATLVNGKAVFNQLTVNKSGNYSLMPSFSVAGINGVASGSFAMAAPSAPTVTSISPSSSPAGSTVTITGSNLMGASEVYFGDTVINNPAVSNSTTIVVTAPEGGSGTVDVKVRTPGGDSAINASSRFTYASKVAGAIVGDWTVIGNASTVGFKYIQSIAVDKNFNVYVTDDDNIQGNRDYIRKRNSSDGTWVDITGSRTFNSPAGIAVDSSGTVYVADFMNQVIVRKGASESIWTVFSNYFTTPKDIFIDSNDNIYVAGNGRVCKWNTVTSSWNDISYGAFSYPVALTADNMGNIYVADDTLDAVLKLPAGSTQWVAIGSGFCKDKSLHASVIDVAADSIGNIYLATDNLGYTWQLPAGYNEWRQICGAQQCLAVDGNDSIYIGNGSGTIQRHPLPATQLIWQTNPGGGTAGTVWAQQPVLRLADISGNTQSEVSGYSVSVNFTGPNAAALGGTKTVPLNNGIAVFTNLTAELGGSYTLTPSSNISGIGLPASSSFSITAGPVSLAQSGAEADKPMVTADGTAFSTITVTLKDQYGNVINGKTVTLRKSTANGSIAAVNPVTDNEGKARFTVKNTVAEAVIYTASVDSQDVPQTVSVTFEAGAPDAARSVLSAGKSTVTADGNDSTEITVILKDAYNNPVKEKAVTLNLVSGISDIIPDSTSTDSTGKAVFIIKGTKAGAVVYRAASNGVTLSSTAQVSFIPGQAEKVSVDASAAQMVGEAFSMTATVKDHYGNTAAGYRGTLKLTSTDAAAILPGNHTFVEADNGSFIFEGIVLRTMGEQTVTAVDTINGSISGISKNLNVAAGNDYRNGTTVAADKTTLTADGIEKTTITVTVKDNYGNPIGFKPVTLSGDSDSTVVTAVYGTSGIDGTAVFEVRDTVAEQVIYTANVNGQTVNQTIQINFVPGEPEAFAIRSPSDIVAGTPFETTVTVNDYQGNTVTSYTGAVKLRSTDAAALLPTDYNFAASDNGSHKFTGIIFKTAGAQTLSATDTIDPGITGTSASITVSPSSEYSLNSTMVVSKQTVTADGIDSADITVALIDDYGNPASGRTIVLDKGGSSSVVTAVKGITDAAGIAVFTVTDTKAEQTIYSASIDGKLLNKTVQVNFVPGPVESISIIGGTEQTAGTAFSATVNARDHNGNIVTEYTGTVQLTSSDTAAVLPAAYTFTSADKGSHIFAGIILKTAGITSITATDTLSPALTATIGNITVSADSTYGTYSTIESDKSVVTADGADYATITLTVIDSFGNLVGNKPVVFSHDSDSSVAAAVYGTTGVDGAAVFTVTNTAAEKVTYTATIGGVSLNRSVQVTFVPGALEKLSVSTDATQNAGMPFSIVVAAVDHNGNTVKDYTGAVILTSTDASATLPLAHTFGAADNGEYTFSGIILRSAGKHIVTAVDTTNSSITGTTADITVLNGTDYSGQSSVTASKSTVTANGIEEADITVIIKDNYGNPISGKQVVLGQGTGGSAISVVHDTTDIDGIAAFTVKSTKAETIIYEVTVDGELLNKTAQVSFLPGTAISLDWKSQPGGGAAGQIWSKQPVLVLKDAYGNVNTDDSSSTVSVELVNPGAAVLGGTTSVTLVNGEAVFVDLSVDKVGSFTLISTIDTVGIDVSASKSFRISHVPAPYIQPDGGTFTGSADIAIDYTAGNDAYYSLDGSDPTQDGILYLTPFTIYSNTTVIAAVYEPNNGDWSALDTADFIIQLPMPAASLADGSTVLNNSTVILSSATAGTSIYHTVDGSMPGTSCSTNNQVLISGAAGSKVTVKAYAAKKGCMDSQVAVFTYTIQGNPPDPEPAGDNEDNEDVRYEPPVVGPRPENPAPAMNLGGNASVNVHPVIDVGTGIASAALDMETLSKAFDMTPAGENGEKTVELNIPQIEGATAYECNLPGSFLTSGDANRLVHITTELAEITVSGDMLRAVSLDVHNISLIVGEADKSSLAADVQRQIGDAPVIDLYLMLAGQKLPWSNHNTPVVVAVPYTPTAEEMKDPEHITVWYIDSEGNTVSIPSGRYDPATGKVTFSTTHFSQYAVVYVEKTFSDMGSYSWARKQIEVLASKGIIKATSEKTFSPQVNISRGDYLVLLAKTLGLTADFDSNFADVKPTDYYYEAAGIARKLGIAIGDKENRFDPRTDICRQDMMVLTARALEISGKLKPVQETSTILDQYSDKAGIAVYAVESTATLVSEKLITGSEGRLNPVGHTTRAEAAVLLYRIYNRYND